MRRVTETEGRVSSSGPFFLRPPWFQGGLGSHGQMTSWEPRRYVTHVERERVAGISQPLAEPADVPRSGWREKPTRANENKGQAVREREGEREGSREEIEASRPQSVKPVRGPELQLWRVRGRSQRRHTQTVEWRKEEKQRERKEQFVLRVLEYRGGPTTTCGAEGPQIDGGKKLNQQLKITRFKSHFSPERFFFLFYALQYNRIFQQTF